MMVTGSAENEAAAAKLTKHIQELGDWRGETLAHVRRLIHEADPDIEEEWKWVKPSSPGMPVWSHSGGICTGETYKTAVKLTFFRGATLPDPENLFTQPGTVRRAIDLHEGEMLKDEAFKKLIVAAVAANLAAKKK